MSREDRIIIETLDKIKEIKYHQVNLKKEEPISQDDILKNLTSYYRENENDKILFPDQLDHPYYTLLEKSISQQKKNQSLLDNDETETS